jgi:hypothetical protein
MKSNNSISRSENILLKRQRGDIMNARNKIQKNIYELSIKIIWLLIFILWDFVNCAGVTANQRLLSKKRS